MRRIFLVRHGEPDTGTTERICLGRKDLPLSERGRGDIQRLSGYFCRQEIAHGLTGIFCSPLKRCTETAEILCDAINQTYSRGENAFSKKENESAIENNNPQNLIITTVENLQEVSTGIWDGLTFKEIKERFPEEYEERGNNLGRYRIPGGESLEEAGRRFLDAVETCLATTEGDLLLVTHAGVIRSFLCLISGRDVNEVNFWKIPYGSVTEVLWNMDPRQDGRIQGPDLSHWIIEKTGFLPVETLTNQKVEALWREAAVTEEQKAHMRATAAFAMELAENLPEFSQREKEILSYSTLLHDILRSTGRGHEEAGADWLLKKGYYELAEPVRMHNDPRVTDIGKCITIAELLYYADKRCKGTSIVSIQERFDSSKKKIRDEKGLMMHKERMEAAFAIEKKVLSEYYRKLYS